MIRFRYMHLYAEPSSSTLDIDAISDYIASMVKCEVDVRKEFFTHFLPRDKADHAAREMAAARVFNTRMPYARHEPSAEDAELEKTILSDPGRRYLEHIYDGFEAQKILEALIPAEENSLDHVHIAFTNRLLCTYSWDDLRYHYRTIICGYPSIICTSGIVEAPAKPREFYLLYNYYASMGMASVEELKKKFEGRFIDYDDPRLTEVVKGFVLQAVFYYLVGDPFCEKKDCRLLNAHWQEDMIESQLKHGRLCDEHLNTIRKLGRQ